MSDQPQTPLSRPQNSWLYATKPTGITLFLRTFLPWQIIRFAAINLKMVRIIGRSHH